MDKTLELLAWFWGGTLLPHTSLSQVFRQNKKECDKEDIMDIMLETVVLQAPAS